MKQLITFLCFVLIFSSGWTQDRKIRKGRDGLGVYNYKTVTISEKGLNGKKSRKLQKQMKKFNKLRYHVLKVWPYANEAKKNMQIIEADLAKIADKSERKKYLKTKEKGLFGKHEKDLKKLSFTQGKILVKLIDRQTGVTTFELIKELKGSGSAFFWQALGGIFGYNLKKEYEADEDDKAVEYIVKTIESGSNPTFYDWVKTEKN